MNHTLAVEENEVREGLKLEISRTIRAPRARVFEAWTRPELLQRWFGPATMTVASATTDVRGGGAYRIEMQGAGSEAEPDMSRRAAASGVYTAIVPNDLLAFTWRGDWEPTEETLVTVTFKDVEGGTELVLTHERFLTEKSMAGHQHGWSESLDKLARVLGQ